MFNNEDYQFILHEIKNHVCLINSSIQLIEKKYPTVQELNGWDMVTSNVTSLKNLFYEINNTKTCNTISKKEINIYTFMEDFKKSITPLFSYASNQNIQSIYKIEENLPSISFDSTRIQDVMLNLTKNAIEAMEHSISKILIIHIFQQDNFLCISFTDNGTGMSMETINSIFKPAFTTKETGSGFGLVIAKHIVELHNGNLLCDSTLNKGTTFTIQLPF